MKTTIPLPSGRTVEGQTDWGQWRAGDLFAYCGRAFQFLGRDSVGGLHARRLENGQLCVFESAADWQRTLLESAMPWWALARLRRKVLTTFWLDGAADIP